MASYRDTPEPAWPGTSGRRKGLFVDQKMLTARQKILQLVSIFAWVILCFAAFAYESGLSDGRLDQARSSTTMTSLWFQPDGWIETSLMAPMMLGLLLLVLNLRAISKLTALAILLAVLVGGSAMAQRGYVMVMDDQVLIHPALPWHHDVRFTLANATVTARGCHLWHSKNSTHHQIIFKVRGGPGRGHTVDLGEAAGRDIGAWLAVMRDYDDGYLQLPPGSGANTTHNPDCLRYWLYGLSPQQATEFNRLVG